MKLKNLFVASAAAAISYWAISNRKEIAEEAQYKQGLLDDMSHSYARIQKQIETLKQYRQPLQELTQELQYKLRVYQQEATGHLSEIQAIQDKYNQEEHS